jgi:hypothetical protein
MWALTKAQFHAWNDQRVSRVFAVRIHSKNSTRDNEGDKQITNEIT